MFKKLLRFWLLLNETIFACLRFLFCDNLEIIDMALEVRETLTKEEEQRLRLEKMLKEGTEDV